MKMASMLHALLRSSPSTFLHPRSSCHAWNVCRLIGNLSVPAPATIALPGNYRIELLSAATFLGALNVIRVAFYQNENICIGTEVNKNPAAVEELLEICADAALDGSSLVAIDTTANKVVAVIFNKLQVPSNSAKTYFERFGKERCSQAESRAFIQFIVDIEQKFNAFEIYKEDCGMEIMFLGTLQEYRKLNLGYTLCCHSIELAKKLKDGPVAKVSIEDLGPIYSKMMSRTAVTKHPKFCTALCTTAASQKIAKRLGFTTHFRLPFEEYVYDGKSLAERIGFDPHYEGVGLKLY